MRLPFKKQFRRGSVAGTDFKDALARKRAHSAENPEATIFCGPHVLEFPTIVFPVIIHHVGELSGTSD